MIEKFLAGALLATSLISAGATAQDRTLNGFVLDNALIPIGEIHQGGPLRDGIPALDQPKFVPGSNVGFLQDTELVLGINRNGIARA